MSAERLDWDETHEWWADGFYYAMCTRCGINMKLPDTSTRRFCDDCTHPDFMSAFDGTLTGKAE